MATVDDVVASVLVSRHGPDERANIAGIKARLERETSTTLTAILFVELELRPHVGHLVSSSLPLPVVSV